MLSRKSKLLVLYLFISSLLLLIHGNVFAVPSGVEIEWVNSNTVKLISVSDPGGTSIGGKYNVDFKRVQGTYSRVGDDEFAKYLVLKSLADKFADKFPDSGLEGGGVFRFDDNGCKSFIYASKTNAYVLLDPRVPEAGDCLLAKLDSDLFVKNFILYTTNVKGGEDANTMFVRNKEDDIITTPLLPGVNFIKSSTPNIYVREDEDGKKCQDIIKVNGTKATLIEMKDSNTVLGEDVPGYPGCEYVRNAQEGELKEVANAEEAAELTDTGGGEDGDAEQGANAQCMANSRGFGLAWIMCPLYNAAESAMNKLLNYLHDIMYTNLGESNDELKQAWGSLKNVANVLFVVALLLILIGQAIKGSW